MVSAETNFNLLLPRLKVQSHKKIFQKIAVEIPRFCRMDENIFNALYLDKLIEQSFCIGRGILVFDMISARVQSPAVVLATLESPIDLNAPDGQGVDIVAGVVSPLSYGTRHLQILSGVSRILKNDGLCNALRGAKDMDDMSVLLLSARGHMLAA